MASGTVLTPTLPSGKQLTNYDAFIVIYRRDTSRASAYQLTI